jgi:prevent-host-death family protein
MKSVLISDFKARCIKMLKDVRERNEPLVVTLRGKPLVTILPFQSEPVLGALEGQLEINGDIVQLDWSDEWEEPR